MAQPALALSLIQELGLAPAVYNPPEHLVPSPPEGGIDWARGAAVARAVGSLLGFRASISEVEMQGGGACLERDEVRGLPAAAVEHEEDENSREGVTIVKTGTAGAQANAEPSSGGGAGKPRADGEGSPHGGGNIAGSGCASKGGDEGSDGRTKLEQAPTTLVREIFLCAALVSLAGVKHKAKKGKLVSAPQSVVAESLKVRCCEEMNTCQPPQHLLKGLFVRYGNQKSKSAVCQPRVIMTYFLTSNRFGRLVTCMSILRTTSSVK